MTATQMLEKMRNSLPDKARDKLQERAKELEKIELKKLQNEAAKTKKIDEISSEKAKVFIIYTFFIHIF